MVENKNKIETIVADLWKNPTDKTWEKFASELKKDKKIKYYKTIYTTGKIKRFQDLKQSYAILYDTKYKVVTKVPLFMKRKEGLTGATIYLMGLSVLNG
jgi:hypothetical protein